MQSTLTGHIRSILFCFVCIRAYNSHHHRETIQPTMDINLQERRLSEKKEFNFTPFLVDCVLLLYSDIL